MQIDKYSHNLKRRRDVMDAATSSADRRRDTCNRVSRRTREKRESPGERSARVYLFIRDICLTINRRLISLTTSNYINNGRKIVVKRAKLLKRRAELVGLDSERFDYISLSGKFLSF